jgi:hypothetical protein
VNNAAPGGQQKKGMSGLAIGLIIGGVVLVLGFGTCIGAGWYMGRQLKKVTADLADGGLVLVSPPEVQAALTTGDKKEYVGNWRATSGGGDSLMVIQADGSFTAEFYSSGGGHTKYTNIPIASFRGDSIEIKPVISVVIDVTQKPHEVGGKWEMTAKGTKFERVGIVGKGTDTPN